MMNQAETFQDAVEKQEFHKIAASPLLLEIISRLGIEQIIDEHAPSGEKQQVSHARLYPYSRRKIMSGVS